MRFTTSRYIPKGSTKVSDRQSDAIAYVYSERGRHYALGYCGKRNRDDFHSWFKTEAARESYVRNYFEARRGALGRKAERRADPGKGRKLEVGHILKASWGYEQTNIDFYEVTALVGATMVEIREIAQSRTGAGAWEQYHCVPMPGEYVGPPLRRKVSKYDGASVSVDDVRSAFLWNGTPAHATSYA